MVKSRECICYPIVGPGNVLQMEVEIILHAKHGQWADQNHHRLALWGARGHDLNDGCIVTVYQDPLAFELIPQMASANVTAYNSLQFDAHEFIPQSQCLGICPDTSVPESSSQSQYCWCQWKVDIPCWWTSAIHIRGWHPIPCSQILEPQIKIPLELLVQINSVMEVLSLWWFYWVY